MTSAALTRTRQEEFSSAVLVAALESAWSTIRDLHVDVPAVVLIVGSGSPSGSSGSMKWGHFAEAQWQHGEVRLPEVLVSGEGLRRGAGEVLTTLLHEAAHGVVLVRSIVDTSRQGRWHNKRFATLATELGLTVTQDPKIGWSPSELGPGTADLYRNVLADLTEAISAYRHPDASGNPGTSRASTSRVLEYTCPRKIRVSASTAAEGPILCGVCGTPFVDDDSA